MADARQQAEWNRTAHLLCLTANIHRDAKKKRSPYCYQVSETTDAETDPELEYQGPFETCDDCLAAPVSARKRRVLRVWHDDMNHELLAEVEEEIVENGVIVGYCPLDEETIAETGDCP